MFSAYLFAGIAMLFWGIAPIFGKLGLGNTQPLVALTIRSLIISIILLITVTVSGQWGNILSVTSKNATYIAIEGICAALVGQFAYYYALKYGNVSQISPLVAAFPLIALLLGIIVLGEKITLYKVAASFLIVGGVVLMKY
jgi:transporter family protein